MWKVIEELFAQPPKGLAPPFGGWGGFLGDLSQNLQKINLHGKRASNIVKGMLEHSRLGTGERRLVNLNNLANEYLNIAYQGLRAKDKSFNIEMITDFDYSLHEIEVVPQDMGRVLLNLYNNAFMLRKRKRRNWVMFTNLNYG